MTLEKTHLVVGAGGTWNEKDPVLPKGKAAAPPNTPLTRMPLNFPLTKRGNVSTRKAGVASPSNFAC